MICDRTDEEDHDKGHRKRSWNRLMPKTGIKRKSLFQISSIYLSLILILCIYSCHISSPIRYSVFQLGQLLSVCRYLFMSSTSYFRHYTTELLCVVFFLISTILVGPCSFIIAPATCNPQRFPIDTPCRQQK
jgi:hypothetical protein